MTAFSRLAVPFALAATVSAQTFVVDVNNGPNTDYVTLEAALAGAPDGATLIVRAGVYTNVAGTFVNGKGVTILGEPGTISSSIYFSGLNANQRVVVKGLRFGFVWTIPSGALSFQSCAGSILVEDVAATGSFSPLSFTNCTQATVVRSVTVGATFSASNVVCVDSTMWGVGYTGPGVALSGGRTQLVNCQVTGATGPGGSSGPGIDMNGGDLRLLGDCDVSCGVTGGLGGNFAIRGTGAVRAAPTVGLVSLPASTPPTTTGISIVTVDEGATSSTAAPLGGVVTGKLEGSANLFGGLVFGSPQAPQTFPDVAEELWVNPLGFAITGQLGAPLTFWLDVPNAPVLRGWTLGWQGLTLGPTGLVLSNPAWFCVQ